MTETDPVTAPTVPEENAPDDLVDTSASGGRVPKRDFEIPYRYETTATTAEVVAAYGDIEDLSLIHI